MKKVPLLMVVIAGLLLAIFASPSCKKKTDPVPDFPQLIGHWSGTTSQSTEARFMIDNLKGYLYVTQYDLTVYTSGGIRKLSAAYTWGLAAVVNRQFKIHLGTGSAGESYIDGTFNVNDMTLYGTFAVYPENNTTDIVPGTYSCSMVTK
jgi:hypothetical protein